MAIENITLNIIPTGDTPSIHVAQFDVDRPFTVTLKEGADDFTPTDYDIELQVRKVDATIVTVLPTQTSGNVVTFNTTEQMTACSGTNLAELQLTKDSQTFATLHFYLVVQRDVLAGGVTSESDIYNLTEQIAAIVPEVIGDDYYNKEEVDEKIAEIPTFDPINYYDKSDVDALLNDKADVSDLPDMSNYYDKLETDALLEDKADVSDLPDMTDYYTKSEVDTKITDLYQIKTASGSLVHITDGADNIPVKSLASEIVAVQSGSGTKSPSNPYTISGFDSGIVTRCGKNIFPLVAGTTKTSNGITWKVENDLSISVRGTVTGRSFFQLLTHSSFKPNTYTYLIEKSGTNADTITWLMGSYYKATGAYRRNEAYPTHETFVVTDNDYANTDYSMYFDIPATAAGTAFDCTLKIQIEIGNQATTYEAYNGNAYTFTFGQTVYGGYFDNKGNLVVTHGYIASYNGESINEPWISSMDDYVPNTLPSTGAQVVYPLTTPTLSLITAQKILTLSGENNIFSNTGTCEVSYFTEKSDGIAELIKAFM